MELTLDRIVEIQQNYLLYRPQILKTDEEKAVLERFKLEVKEAKDNGWIIEFPTN